MGSVHSELPADLLGKQPSVPAGHVFAVETRPGTAPSSVIVYTTFMYSLGEPWVVARVPLPHGATASGIPTVAQVAAHFDEPEHPEPEPGLQSGLAWSSDPS